MRLIDADALMEKYGEPCHSFADVIENMPTLDYAPVVHGEWIEQEITPGDFYYTCSVCKEDWFILDSTPAENFMNYCPHCGAKMDGGKKDV